MQRITIIGGGASGTLLAVNLLKNGGANPLEINLIEKKERLNRGLAYSTSQFVHLLNVPAAKMGAFPDDVEHFHRWLLAQNLDYKPTDFAPRQLYGKYLGEVFAQALAEKSSQINFNFYDGEAVDVNFGDDSAQVVLDSGETIESDEIVIAFGNFLPANLPTKHHEYLESAKYFRNAYDTEIVEKVADEDEILLIGTGLTAVDNILSFYHRGHSGKITMLSTHGWLPTVHAPAEAYQSFENELKGERNLLKAFKIVRRHIQKAENWRAAIDAMRPLTAKLWFDFPTVEKRRFMRHLRRLWDISRHRIPPECAKICDELEHAGKLEIINGKITDIELANDKFTVSYKNHGTIKTLAADAIINCTGSESNFSRLESALVQNLLQKGATATDELRMGLAATADGVILDAENAPSKQLRTLGTALKGILYESTAMPEIRAQARNLAVKLLDEN